jgi:hypothetical protein
LHEERRKVGRRGGNGSNAGVARHREQAVSLLPQSHRVDRRGIAERGQRGVERTVGGIRERNRLVEPLS